MLQDRRHALNGRPRVLRAIVVAALLLALVPSCTSEPEQRDLPDVDINLPTTVAEKGSTGKSLEELLEATGDLKPDRLEEELAKAEGKRKPSLDDLLTKPKPKPDWPS